MTKTKTLTKLSLALTGALLVLFVGCRGADRREFISEIWGDTGGTVVTTDHTTGDSTTEFHSTRVMDRLDLTNVTMDKVNGLNRVHYTMTSTRSSRLRVDARIVWYDANGMELDSDRAPYRNLIIEGHDTVVVTSVAPNARGVKSRLRVRESRYASQ